MESENLQRLAAEEERRVDMFNRIMFVGLTKDTDEDPVQRLFSSLDQYREEASHV